MNLINLGVRIEYNKKPGKPAFVKVVKEPNPPREDLYKSGVIHTGPGEPPNSVSRPTPRGKPGVGKPITSGKLLRPGGPSGGPGNNAPTQSKSSRPVPRTISQSSVSQPATVPISREGPIPQPMPQPTVARETKLTLQPVNSTQSHSRSTSTSSIRAPPPPPPSAPPAPAPSREPTYRALYDFQGQTQRELINLQRDEIVIVLRIDNSGNHVLPSM